MLANLTGLLPLLSVASVLIVSANTIGYFARIGPHFLGLMDFSNFAYPLGLAFLGLLLAIQLLAIAYSFAGRWHNVAEFNLKRMGAFAFVFLGACFIGIRLLFHSLGGPRSIFYELLATTALWIGATIVLGVTAFVKFHQSRGKLDDTTSLFVVVGVLTTAYFIGLAQAEYQAFQTPTLYKITDKHGFDTLVRMIRASSSGLLVSSSDRRIIFVPKEEIRQVESEKPIRVDLSEPDY